MNYIEKFTVVGTIHEVKKNKNLNQFRSCFIRVAKKCEYGIFNISDKHFYINDVWTSELDSMPKEREIEFTLGVSLSKKNKARKFISVVEWKLIPIKGEKQIYGLLKKKLVVEQLMSGHTSLLSANKCKTLVNDFGDKTFRLFKERNTNILLKTEYFNLNVEKCNKACDIISAFTAHDDLRLFLSMHGVDYVKADKIYEVFGDKSFEMIKKDPFLCMSVRGIGFNTCDKIAKDLGVALDSPNRLIAATKAVLDNGVDGNTYLPFGQARFNTFATYLSTGKDKDGKSIKGKYEIKATIDGMTRNVQTDVDPALWGKALEIQSKDDNSFPFRIYNVDGVKCIMTKDDDENEKTTVRRIKEIQSYGKVLKNVDKIIERIEKTNEDKAKKSGKEFFKLSEGQKSGVIKCLTHPVSILTGGPGCGKTTVVQIVIEAYKLLFPNNQIVTMAPTGKACARLSEQTGTEAHTIHKTLEIIPGEENERAGVLPGNALIIVDESSMIDQEVMAKLMKAVPNSSRIILVGDVNQLPSVGKGDVLSQLINSKIIPTAELNEVFRQSKDSPIALNAVKIKGGEITLEWNDLFAFVEANDGQMDVFLKTYKEQVDKFGLKNVMVLCPLRNAGNKDKQMVVGTLNAKIQEVINPKSEDKPESKVRTEDNGDVIFRQGDRVMQWKNREDSLNGDIGEIAKIDVDESGAPIFIIEWEGKDKKTSTYHINDMVTMSLAYAMTIHKSQGSEAECVIMPFIKSHVVKSLYKRNIIYTGITRAKKNCIVIGDMETVNYCITNADLDSKCRKSLLAKRLVLATK